MAFMNEEARLEFEQAQEKRKELVTEIKQEVLAEIKSKLTVDVENYMDYDCRCDETKLKVRLLFDGEEISSEEVRIGG